VIASEGARNKNNIIALWCQANLSRQQPFDPLQLATTSVTTKVLPAPQAIIEMV